MSFELSADHEAFRKVIRDFAEQEVAPYVAEWDREHRFPAHLVGEMGELGLFGITAPTEYGGAGGDFTSLCIAIEELGRVDQSVGITLSAGAEATMAAGPRRRPHARGIRPHRARGWVRRGGDAHDGSSRRG